MQYRALGHTDLKVTLIGLGTMTWGEQNSEADAHEQLDRALDGGVKRDARLGRLRTRTWP
jgi:aryl-alcohol dehydrogenase-like predicted oxidoreductase